MVTVRMTPHDRRDQILNAAIILALKQGWGSLTRRSVAEAADTSAGLVNFYFNNTPGMKDSVMQAAVERQLLPIIADGIAARNKIALSAPSELRLRAIIDCAGV